MKKEKHLISLYMNIKRNRLLLSELKTVTSVLGLLCLIALNVTIQNAA